MHPSISQSNNAKSKGLRLDIGVAFARLQLSYPHNSGGNEFLIHAELLYLEIAISERDFADFESHAARFERAYQGTVIDIRILLVLGAVEQHVHSVGMRDHDDLGVRRHIEMIADIAQCPGGLKGSVIDMVDDLILHFLRQSGVPRKTGEQQDEYRG